MVNEGTMNTAQLLEYHEAICEQARELVKRKNHDYAGESGETPFRNFDVIESYDCGVSSEMGILVRLSDKLSRISTALTCNELKVEDESFDDTIRDGINYLVILSARRQLRRGEVGEGVEGPDSSSAAPSPKPTPSGLRVTSWSMPHG